jgi:hypothetical protein
VPLERGVEFFHVGGIGTKGDSQRGLAVDIAVGNSLNAFIVDIGSCRRQGGIGFLCLSH